MRKVLFRMFGIALVVSAVGYLVSPFFFDRVVAEPTPDAFRVRQEAVSSSLPMISGAPSSSASEVSPPVFREGSFVGVFGHQATGTVARMQGGDEDVLFFEGDFVATNGPDLFVYLGKDGRIDMTKRLGALKGNKGSQVYEIPLNWGVEGHHEVWIWCRAFSVPFARAELRPVVR